MTPAFQPFYDQIASLSEKLKTADSYQSLQALKFASEKINTEAAAVQADQAEHEAFTAYFEQYKTFWEDKNSTLIVSFESQYIALNKLIHGANGQLDVLESCAQEYLRLKNLAQWATLSSYHDMAKNQLILAFKHIKPTSLCSSIFVIGMELDDLYPMINELFGVEQESLNEKAQALLALKSQIDTLKVNFDSRIHLIRQYNANALLLHETIKGIVVDQQHQALASFYSKPDTIGFPNIALREVQAVYTAIEPLQTGSDFVAIDAFLSRLKTLETKFLQDAIAGHMNFLWYYTSARAEVTKYELKVQHIDFKLLAEQYVLTTLSLRFTEEQQNQILALIEATKKAANLAELNQAQLNFEAFIETYKGLNSPFEICSQRLCMAKFDSLSHTDPQCQTLKAKLTIFSGLADGSLEVAAAAKHYLALQAELRLAKVSPVNDSSTMGHFWNWLNMSPDASRGSDTQGFYLDAHYWHCWKQHLMTEPFSALEFLASRLIAIKEELSKVPLSEEERATAMKQFDTLVTLVAQRVEGQTLVDPQHKSLLLLLKPVEPANRPTPPPPANGPTPGRPAGPPRPDQTSVQLERIENMAFFAHWEATLRNKQKEHEDNDHQEAALAAETLNNRMCFLRTEYLARHIDLQGKQGYKELAHEAIETAHGILDQHRGWKQLLINLAIAILTLGVGYLALAAYQGRFYPALSIDTDSKQILDGLETYTSSIGMGEVQV